MDEGEFFKNFSTYDLAKRCFNDICEAVELGTKTFSVDSFIKNNRR